MGILDQLGFDRADGGERVAMLVGPNGAGKSYHLKKIAAALRGERTIAVVSNTAYDRFAGMRGIERISASRSGRSPKGIIKHAVARTIDEPDSRFYQIGKILQYCGYEPVFGFRIDRPRKPFYLEVSPENPELDQADFDASIAFLGRQDPGEIVWIDPGQPVLDFSLAREFASVLRSEDLLRREGLLRGIQVFLRRNDGVDIELLQASSGELALISSLVFLITMAETEPLILIDEPENSLHPTWQREYVDKVLAAMEYRNAAIVIATHAPLVVTGALASFPDLVSVFQMSDGEPHRLDLSDTAGAPGGIEEILWRAFEVITPANHYVSEQLVGVVTQLEEGAIEREEALALVNVMDSQSFDDKQRHFFGAVRELIDKVDAQRQDAG